MRERERDCVEGCVQGMDPVFVCACEQSEWTVFVCRAFLSVCLWEAETDA